MIISKNIKTAAIFAIILIVVLALDYNNYIKETRRLKNEFHQSSYNIAIEKYKLGLTKKEFDKLHFDIINLMNYRKKGNFPSYIDKSQAIKSFCGIEVKQTQFMFAKTDGIFIRSKFLIGINFNLVNVDASDVTSLKSTFGDNNGWSKIEEVTDKSGNLYKNQKNILNDCINVRLVNVVPRKTAHISFSINENIVYPSNL